MEKVSKAKCSKTCEKLKKFRKGLKEDVPSTGESTLDEHSVGTTKPGSWRYI